MRFAPKKMEQAVQLLLSAVGCTESKSECEECLVARDAVDAGRIRYSEAWNTESAFKRHVKSDEFRRVLVAMELSLEEPRVLLGNLCVQNGMAYLQKLRVGQEEPEA